MEQETFISSTRNGNDLLLVGSLIQLSKVRDNPLDPVHCFSIKLAIGGGVHMPVRESWYASN